MIDLPVWATDVLCILAAGGVLAVYAWIDTKLRR
jgi:hypothetical protein